MYKKLLNVSQSENIINVPSSNIAVAYNVVQLQKLSPCTYWK